MQLNTFKKYQFTTNVFNYVTTRDTEGGEVRTYTLLRNIKVHATSSGFGKLVIHIQKSDDDIMKFARFHKLRGPDGLELIEGGVWELTEFEPILNLYSVQVGFKGRANLYGLDS